MEAVNRQINPSSIAAPAANYAHAVLSDRPERWLHTSGVVPTAPDGSTPDEVGAQAAVGELAHDDAARGSEAAAEPSPNAYKSVAEASRSGAQAAEDGLAQGDT